MKLVVPPYIRGLLFDCDGTLVDTMPLHWRAWQEGLKAFGVDVPVSFLEQFSGAIVTDVLARVSRHTGKKLDESVFVPRKQARFREMLHEVRELTPVADIVRMYAGKLPMAVVSGGCRQNVTASLEVVGLLKYFDVIITGDDPFPGKPAPDIMLEAARCLNVEPGLCQVFEDGELGLDAAVAAGMLATDVRPALTQDSHLKNKQKAETIG